MRRVGVEEIDEMHLSAPIIVTGVRRNGLNGGVLQVDHTLAEPFPGVKHFDCGQLNCARSFRPLPWRRVHRGVSEFRNV